MQQGSKLSPRTLSNTQDQVKEPAADRGARARQLEVELLELSSQKDALELELSAAVSIKEENQVTLLKACARE